MRWLQQDAPQLIRDVLRTAVDDRSRVVAVLPKGWTPADGPYVTVVGDGTPRQGQAWSKELVRCTVYGPDGPTVRALMSALEGVLITPRAGGWGCKIATATGLIVTSNSRLGGWVASITIAVTTSKKGT